MESGMTAVLRAQLKTYARIYNINENVKSFTTRR